jgi:central glycolytic genes regulator
MNLPGQNMTQERTIVDKAAALQRKIAPELVAAVEERYAVLRQIRYAQPIGRRALATMLAASERTVRAHIDFLKGAGFIDFSPLGVSITAEGCEILSDLTDYVRALSGLSGLERELAESLGLKQVIVIRGNCDEDPTVKRELGRAAASVLGQHLGDNMIIAVSGGSMMAQVAESITFHVPTTTVVPSRGGLGERVEYQANTIAAVMANRLGGKYRLLHISDGVGEEALEVILSRDGNVRAVAQMIKQADILLTGIGEAAAMASRREFDRPTIDQLERLGAVGEALGHYCTLRGEVVYTTSSVGLHLSDLAGIGKVIGVAGGRNKAGAIVAVVAAGGQDILVTDEAAARAIQDIINNNQAQEEQ